MKWQWTYESSASTTFRAIPAKLKSDDRQKKTHTKQNLSNILLWICV